MEFKDIVRKRREELGLTLEEVGDAVGVSKATIQRYESGNIKNIRRDKINALAKVLRVSPGYLMGWDDFDSAAAELYPNWLPGEYINNNRFPDNILPLPKTKSIPLVGSIACGTPILAVENIEDYVKVDEKIPADFALRCKGDSMINSRIYDGDIVYIRQQSDVDDGEIAAVLIGEEATLKKVYKYSNKVVLRASNPMYDDMVYTDEELENIIILGKAVAFFSLVR